MRPIHTLPAPAVQLDARALARALGGDLVAPDAILCPGPGHSPRDRSLSIKLDAHAPAGFICTSFAGDDWKACRDHVRAAAGIERGRRAPAPSPRPARPARDDQDRTRRALAIWREAQPLAGSLAAQYLAQRGLEIDPDALAHCLRFHPACPTRGERLPCMIAVMADALTGQPCGIQRTPLTPDAHKHPLGRAMLGKAGVCMVSPDEAVTDGLILAEGVEDALALIQAGLEPVWATMSAGAMSRFPILPAIEAITLVCDGDAAGRAAALECAARWQAEGREAEVLTAPDGGDPAALLGAAR